MTTLKVWLSTARPSRSPPGHGSCRLRGRSARPAVTTARVGYPATIQRLAHAPASTALREEAAITPTHTDGLAIAAPDRPRASTAPARLAPGDLGLILLVTALVRWLSGAQRFTFLHTPDSEFYFSLGAFGSAVTDRAPIDSYYWTKLGIILPIRGLTHVMSPLLALDVFHVVLTLLVVGSAYVVARLRWSRLGACVAAAFAALNTVILGFIGDPYASGAALAGLSVLLATMTTWTLGARPFRWWPAALMGAVGAWLIMINPYALIVGAAGCAGILVANAGVVRAAGLGAVSKSAAALVGGLAVAFGTFLALGGWVFPGFDWFTSLRIFLTGNDLANWAAKDWAWLPSEISLLVPATSALVCLLALAATPRSVPVRTGVALVWVTLLVAIAYKIVSDSNVLEHSVYNSMLWPAALLALVLVASETTEPALGWMPVAAGIIAPICWIIAGHRSSVVSTPAAVGAVAGAALCAGALLAWGRRPGRVVVSSAWPMTSVGLVLLLLLGSLFQVLQNGRPEDPTKLHRRVHYSAAFLPNPFAGVLAQDAQIEQWLIEATSPHEQLLVWNEPGTRSAAAMQLWGPNTVGSGFGGPLGASGLATIRSLQPDAVVVYAAESSAGDAVRAELESAWNLADPQCRTFPGDGVPPMQVCVLRLAEPR